MNRPLPHAITKQLQSHLYIPFIGAGASCAVKLRGGQRAFPSWAELLKSGIEEVLIRSMGVELHHSDAQRLEHQELYAYAKAYHQSKKEPKRAGSPANDMNTKAWTSTLGGKRLIAPALPWDDKLAKEKWQADNWHQILRNINDSISELHDNQLLHVVASCPHPVGMYLGHKLKQKRAGLPLAIYQRTPLKGPFELFWWTNGRWSKPETAEAFFDLQIYEGTPVEASSKNVLLTIETGRFINKTQLDQLYQDANIDGGFRLVSKKKTSPMSPSFFEPTHPAFLSGQGDNFMAVTQCAQAIDELGSRYPGATLHIATTGPLGLMIALGYHLDAKVLSAKHIVMWDFSRIYYPTIDVMSGELYSPYRAQKPLA